MHDEFVVGIGVPRVMLICGVTCRQMRAQSNARAEDLRARYSPSLLFTITLFPIYTVPSSILNSM